MSNVLLITSSPRGTASYSTRVARSLAEKLASARPDGTVTHRDLAREPLPHINDGFAAARNTPPELLSAPDKAVLKVSDALISELLAADVIVIAAGMINFGIPSSLKAYIDHVLRPGVTFRYTDKGPVGLVSGKKVYLVVARGGIYSQGPMEVLNFQDPYLKAVLGFIGLTDVEVITLEGIAFGAQAAEQALTGALERVSKLAA